MSKTPMRILILTQYYPPETGAAQNRLHDLALRFHKQGVQVSVVTAMPNYPAMKVHPEYRRKCFARESPDGFPVYRSWIFISKSRSVFLRLLNYFSFVFTSMMSGLFMAGRQDYILCESPPLFLGISAWVLKAFKRAKLIFNVSDLWPESAERLGLVRSRFLLGISYKLEAFLYRRSFLVTGQTMGIVNNIKRRFPQADVFWFRNGIDPGAFHPEMEKTGWRKRLGLSESDFVLLYAGILGHAQGIEILLEAAGRLMGYRDIHFVILGSGPLKRDLVELKEKMGLQNVCFPEPVSKKEIPAVLRECDASVVPLKKLDLFRGAIPSKIFEVLAMEKPVILGVEGEAEKLFIREGQAGLYYEPGNADALKDKILELYSNPSLLRSLGKNGRTYVERYFDRQKIADELLGHIMSKASEKPLI
ncbi:MAG: glycosyltransferase family 4 protein [Bacteroidales bacterium]